MPPRNPLLQLDLLHCILEHLAEPLATGFKPHKGTHLALVALAQTCCALSDPALDHLWRKLFSLEPLIKCYGAVYDGDNKNMMPASPTDWVIIQRYSRRIKELTILPIDKASLCFLQVNNPQPSLLFPNLRRLFWFSHTASVVCLQRCLGPSLVSLTFFVYDLDIPALQLLLTNLCLNVRSVCIWTPATQRVSLGPLSLSSPLCDRLELLQLPAPIDDVALRHIVVSPKLKELALILNLDQSRLHQVPFPSDVTPFYIVKKLYLEVWHLQLVTSLLRHKGQAFHSFSLVLYSLSATSVFSAFLAALLSPQRKFSLRIVTLQSRYWELDLPQAAWRTPLHDVLRPLTCLSHLGKLSIQLNHCSPMGDDELIALVRHWPHLRRLVLAVTPDRRPWESDKCITLNGLVLLVECCPHLERLHLPLDARRVPADMPIRSAVVSALTAIEFSGSPINDPQLVAEFIARHFPSLPGVACEFGSSRRDDEEILWYKAAWGQVQTRLEELGSQHTERVMGASFLPGI